VIEKGQNNKLITNAQQGNFRKVDNTGRMSIGQVLLNKTVEKVGELVAEGVSEMSSSKINYVMVEADCINGLLPCIEENLQISGGTGRFEPSFNKARSGAIHKDYQGNVKGTYNFSVKLDNNICTGSFYISGTKKNYTISLGKDCKNNGSREW